MAASAVASALSPSPFIFPSLSPQYLIYSPSIWPKFPPFASTATARCSFSVSAASSSVTSEENKRMMLEGYGLNPDEYISDQTLRPPRRSREEQMKMRKMMKKGKNGKGRSMQEELVAVVEGKKATRSTHKLLKVLGGTARRKKLLSPKSMDVRPMMEVVRGAAFDILQVAGGCPASLRPGRWLDLYSGTGSVGIEAISRGCSEAHFVELDPWVVSEVLKPNLEWTGFLDSSVIHTKRVESFLEQAGFSGAEEPFDYISVTPPYTAVDYKILLGQLGQSPLVGEDCFILVEYPLETTVSDSCGHLIKISDRRFGRTNLIIYGPEWAQKKRRT